MRMLDLFAGRLGWSKAFLARGWEVTAIDLVEPPEIPAGVEFIQADVMQLTVDDAGWWVTAEDGGYLYSLGTFDFGCASSPCETFSVWGMRHFHPNPPYPEAGIALFTHTRALFERAEIPYVMENVRAAQQFIGKSDHRCGPFHLWGNSVPPLMPQGITKGIDVGSSKLVKGMTREEKRAYRAQFTWNQAWSTSKRRQRDTARAAEIPPELANCVAEYAERICSESQLLTTDPHVPLR